MNLIDFNVTKIIGEEKDIVYKLYDYSEEYVKSQEDDDWKKYLLGNGIKQTFLYYDDGGERTGTRVFNTDFGQTPYYVGYVGQH